MPFPPIDKSLIGLLSDTVERLTLVERRLTKGSTPVSTGTIVEGAGIDITGTGTTADPYAIAATASRGTTAERNTLYGVPSTAAQQAALANQKVWWFNTDLGWAESYYAPTGTAGLTAPALIAAAAAGWYPLGPGGPRMYTVPSAQQSMSNGQYFVNWTAPGTGIAFRTGGASFLEIASGVPRPKIAGRYAVDVRMSVQAGSGQGVLYLTLHNPAGTQAAVLDQDTLILNATYGMMYKLQVTDYYMGPDDSIRIYTAAGIGGAIFGVSGNGVIASSGFYNIRYIGPPLVSN